MPARRSKCEWGCQVKLGVGKKQVWMYGKAAAGRSGHWVWCRMRVECMGWAICTLYLTCVPSICAVIPLRTVFDIVSGLYGCALLCSASRCRCIYSAELLLCLEQYIVSRQFFFLVFLSPSFLSYTSSSPSPSLPSDPGKCHCNCYSAHAVLGYCYRYTTARCSAVQCSRERYPDQTFQGSMGLV